MQETTPTGDQVKDRVRLVDHFDDRRRDDSRSRTQRSAQRRERAIEVDAQKIRVLKRVAPAREGINERFEGGRNEEQQKTADRCRGLEYSPRW